MDENQIKNIVKLQLEEFKKTLPVETLKLVKDYMKSSAFTDRKLTDTPTDDLQVVNRKYTNLYGSTSSRPTPSVASRGQQYFDTTIGRPIYFNPNSSVWTDGAGSVS